MTPTTHAAAEPQETGREFDHTTSGRATGRPTGPLHERLTPQAVRMVAVLRPKASVLQTAALFPQLINRLAGMAPDPASMLRLLDEMIGNDRPDREGLPFQVRMELTRLHEKLQGEVRRGPDRG
jgi:broad specificity phosphatase PhoE